MSNEIRSAIISFSLQDHNMAAKLAALNGSSDAVVQSMRAMDVTGHQAQKRLREMLAISGANALESKQLADQTAALNGFFGQMDHAAGAAAASQTILGRATYGVQTALRNMSGSIQSAGQSLVNFSENNKMALAAVSALSTGLIYATAGAAAEDERVGAAFHAMVSRTGADADQLLANMKRMSAGTVDETALMQTAIKATAAGISLDQIPAAMDVARRASRITGRDVKTAFDMMIEGSVSQRAGTFKDMGINIDATEAQETYAASIGKIASALTAQEGAMAMLSAATKYGQENLTAVETGSTNAGESFAQLSANVNDLSGEIGKAFLPAASGAAKALGYLTGAVKDHPWVAFTFAVGLASAALGSMALLALPGVVSGLTILTGGTFWATLSTQGLTAALKASKVAMVAGVVYTKGLAAANYILSGAAWSAAGGIWAALAPVVAVVAAFASLALITQDLYTGLTGGKSAIMDFMDSIGNFKYMLIWLYPFVPIIQSVLWAFLNWRQIPGIISGAISGAVNYLAGLPAVFFDAGAGMFNAFISGMKSVPLVGPVINALEKVRSYLPFSDAKVGPLADLTLSGQRFIQTFGAGAKSQQGYLSSLMGGLLKMPEVMLDFAKPVLPSLDLVQALINPIVNQPQITPQVNPAVVNPLVNQPTINPQMQFPTLTIPGPGGNQAPAQTAPIQVSLTFGDVHLSGDEKTLNKFSSITVDAVEKALDKIIRKQASAVGL